MTVELPRHVIAKRLKTGETAFYYNVPTRYREMKCPIPNEPLGKDFAHACKKATSLNGLFDEWDEQRKGLPISTPSAPKRGSVDWLFKEYKQSLAYLKKVAPRSRRDYEWAMALICDTLTKSGRRVGERPIKTISPRGADKLYQKILEGPKGRRDRTAEKIVKLCRKAWRVVHRLHPEEFDREVPNPWLGVTLETRVKAKKPAVTREQVYSFANGCIALGEPEAAATAVICFEWLQRPENVLAGHIKWSDYRAPSAPSIIRIAHHKTGTIAPHPLEERQADGSTVKFYADAEEILSALPRRGIPMILREVSKDVSKPYAFSSMQHIVQRMRKELELPSYFTLDACRHGGMTELEEAELTDGQGRALSTHKTQQSYEGYAKRTEKRMLSATRKRYAHRLALDMNGENELGPVCMPRDYRPGDVGYIYFAKSGDFLKIGFTSHIPTRLAEINTPEPLVLVHYEAGTMTNEKIYHERFASHRVRGEWFRIDMEIVSFIRGARQRTPVQNEQQTDFRMKNISEIP